jgi:hypothetical protein
MKPSVFIGSSSEGLPIAEALFTSLSFETTPTLWTHQLFLPGQYPLEVLEKELRRHAFAVLIASPDDELVKRGVTTPAMRDNLLLEFGLFAGALGRRRTFFVCPSTPTISIPSDLFGIVTATYDTSRIQRGASDRAAAVQVAAQQIRTVIAEEWMLIQAQVEAESARLRSSKRGQAIQRLHGVAVQLRDALIVLQRDAFAAFSDESAFNNAKGRADASLRQIADGYRDEAEEVGVDRQLQELLEATAAALIDLPFPRELALGRQAAQHKAFRVGMGALDKFLQGGDPVRHVRDVASDEAENRFAALRQRYAEWWDHHCLRMQEAAGRLQDALLNAAIALSLGR